MNTKTLFKNIGVAFLFQIAIKLVWVFVVDRGAQNQFGEQWYGQYFSYMQLLTILVMVADGGLHNYATQYLNNNLAQNLPKIIKHLKDALCLMYLIICAIILWFVPSNYKLLYILIAILQLFNSYFLWARALLRGHLQNKHDAIVSTIDKLLVVLFAFTAWFFFTDFINIFTFIYVQILGLGVAIIYAKTNTPVYYTNNTAVNLTWQNIAKAAVKFGLLLVIMTAIYRQDAYILNLLHPSSSIAAGRYAAAFRLLDAANMLGYVAATYFFSFVVLHKHNISYLKNNANKLAVILVGVASIGVIIFLFAGNFIGHLLYKNPNNETLLLVQFIMVVLPAIFIVHIYGTLLSATNHIKSFLIISIGIWGLNILSNIIGITYFGIMGCLYAAIITQYFYAAICVYKVNSISMET